MGFFTPGTIDPFDEKDSSQKRGFSLVAVVFVKDCSAGGTDTRPVRHRLHVETGQPGKVGNFGQRDIDNGGVKIYTNDDVKFLS